MKPCSYATIATQYARAFEDEVLIVAMNLFLDARAQSSFRQFAVLLPLATVKSLLD
jgi:hypothetical protein